MGVYIVKITVSDDRNIDTNWDGTYAPYRVFYEFLRDLPFWGPYPFYVKTTKYREAGNII